MAGTAAAADYRANAEDYRDYLHRLQPGDRLQLAPGDYRQGLLLSNLSGRAGQPIVIEAANPAVPPRFIARPGVNTVSLVDVRYVSVRNLELDGRNLPVDAVKAEGHSHYADFITLDHLTIHDYAASQQNVGISTKCPAFGWVVKGNRIERVGTGMYFGNSDGTDPFVNGLIEANQVTETLGYNLQIKHQINRSTDQPELGRQHETVIRDNIFSKENAVVSDAARPNVLVGHWPLEGVGRNDRYFIHSNLFWQNPGEALFQGEGNIMLCNNVLANSNGSAIRIQPHNDVPRNVDVQFNTVWARDAGIAIRNKLLSGPWRQRVSGNLVFAGQPLSGGIQTDNLALKYGDAERYLKNPSTDLANADFSLKRNRQNGVSDCSVLRSQRTMPYPLGAGRLPGVANGLTLPPPLK
jgi:hypothetical protein